MKTFELTKKMSSMGGVFYPTGYAVIMFSSEAEARQVAGDLEPAHEGIMLLEPDAVLRDIGKVHSNTDVHLPDVGTEGATVNKYVALAREGHYGLMIPTSTREHTENIMAVVRKVPFSYAQKYHRLAIEDLE